jgi:hypothetical protein
MRVDRSPADTNKCTQTPDLVERFNDTENARDDLLLLEVVGRTVAVAVVLVMVFAMRVSVAITAKQANCVRRERDNACEGREKERRGKEKIFQPCD